MTRKEALQALGLGPKANEYEIESRYALLLKGLVQRTDEEGVARRELINQAYRHLKGDDKPFVPPTARDRRVILGRTVYQWRNFFDYGWRPMLGILAATILVISIIVTVVTNKPPDLQLAGIGEMVRVNELTYRQDVTPRLDLEDYARETIGVERPAFEVLTIGAGTDPQMEMAALTKRMIYMSGQQKTDLMLLDDENFELFFVEDIFMPLDEVWATLVATHGEEAVRRVFEPVTRTPKEESELQEGIYAFACEDSGLFEAFGLFGPRMLLVRPLFEGHPEAALALLDQFVADQERLLGMVEEGRQPPQTEGSEAEASESASDAS